MSRTVLCGLLGPHSQGVLVSVLCVPIVSGRWMSLEMAGEATRLINTLAA